MRRPNWFSRTAWAAVFATLAAFLGPAHQILAQADTWTTKAPMPTPRCCFAAATVQSILYAAGGFADPTGILSVLEAYDPKTDTWVTKRPMPTPRVYSAADAVDGIMYVVGGDSHTAGYLNTVEAYDPKTDTWSTKPPMLTGRALLALAAVDGILYAVGGNTASGFVGTVEAYDPKTNTWSAKAPMPTPRRDFGIGVVNGILYAVGGTNVHGIRIQTLEAYDPKTDTWNTKAPIPTARDGLAVAVVDGTLYALGGDDAAFLATVEAYDSRTDSWTNRTAMPTGRRMLASSEIQDTIYVVGGIGFTGGLGSPPFLAVNEAFSPFLHVAIDIKPGDAGNTINLKSQGVVAVAILGSATFDPLTVDPATVTLAGAPVATKGQGQPMVSQGDFNRDGYLDLLLHFRTRDLKLTLADTEAVLYGTTTTGQRIRGADSVRIIRFAPAALSNLPAPLKRRHTASRPNSPSLN